jgi:hypothetical protein
VEITSLNSHFAEIYSGTRYGFLSTWRKRNPHRPVQLPRPVRAKGWARYGRFKHTPPAGHLTTGEIEATTLFLLVC